MPIKITEFKDMPRDNIPFEVIDGKMYYRVDDVDSILKNKDIQIYNLKVSNSRLRKMGFDALMRASEDSKKRIDTKLVLYEMMIRLFEERKFLDEVYLENLIKKLKFFRDRISMKSQIAKTIRNLKEASIEAQYKDSGE